MPVEKIQHIDLFDMVLEKAVPWETYKGHVLWLDPPLADVHKLLQAACEHGFYELRSLTLAVSEMRAMAEVVKSRFRIVKAGGGVVEKGDQVLLIYRRGRWDLPKGKRKSKESYGEAALREVAEECGIEVRGGQKIVTTHHIIPIKGDGYGLKKTKWYHMTLLDDSHMQPQQAEGIEKVEWFEAAAAYARVAGSYPSIRYVMSQYRLQRTQRGH